LVDIDNVLTSIVCACYAFVSYGHGVMALGRMLLLFVYGLLIVFN